MIKSIKIFLLFYNMFCFGQKNILKEIKAIEGIWIAQDFYNSFEEIKSAIKSKNAFDFTSPVAIRINSKEIKKGVLNIGYSLLHDHMLHPEVSDYIIKEKDTIHEYSFKINLNKKDSIGYHKTTPLSYFFSESITYLTWDKNKPSLILYIPEENGHQEKYIKYKRITTSFKNNYLFPNPLYYYTRQKTIVGNYTLKDSEGNRLCENLKINPNGITSGFPSLENFTAYFSTDVYCGPPEDYDLVMFFDNILMENSKSYHFYYIKNIDGNIGLYERLSKNGLYQLGKKVYELIKN